jgi:hypothetical protein
MKSLKFQHVGFSLAVVLGLGAGSALLYAQPAGDVSDTSASGSASASVSLSANMSLADMLAKSTELNKNVRTDLRHVIHLQDVARKDKDVIKLTCVNDKLLQMKAEANIFDNYRSGLEGMSEDSRDRATTFDEEGKAADRVHRLRTEADGCLGEKEIGTESANRTVHPPFPDDPTEGDPFDEGVEPPGYASPYN